MIKIVKAAREHLDDIAPLFNAYRVFYKATSDMDLAIQFMSERLEKLDSVIFIAYQDGSAIGFTQLYPSFSSVSAQRLWILNDLYVKNDSRGKGIGESLLNRAKEFTIQDGAKGLALETGKENPAQKLYERLGWKLEDDYLHYFWTC